MNYLLNTHTFLWTLTEKRKLSSLAFKIIENTDNTILVSAISFWEISLKASLNKLDITGFSPEELPDIAIKSGFELLAISPEFSASYHLLPYLELHRDPFDRMLIWQAIQEQFVLISNDEKIKQYKSVGLKLLW